MFEGVDLSLSPLFFNIGRKSFQVGRLYFNIHNTRIGKKIEGVQKSVIKCEYLNNLNVVVIPTHKVPFKDKNDVVNCIKQFQTEIICLQLMFYCKLIKIEKR